MEWMAGKGKTHSETFGLKINAAKTNIMTWNGKCKVEIDRVQVDTVDKFKYLGSTITTVDSTMTEVKTRLAIARSVMSDMSDVWKSKKLSLELKKRLVKSLV